MDPNTLNLIAGAAGAAGGDTTKYVEEVFSTDLWNGNYDTTPAPININNGIDLTEEGGLVWTKNRNYANSHQLYDTERGASKPLYSNINNGEGGNSVFDSFNSNGFSLTAGTWGTDALNGDSGHTWAAWTFRKAPGFFDVVEWTGNSTAGREIPHNLGSVPGMIFVKCVSNSGHWAVYHKDLTSADYLLRLNDNYAQWSDSTVWDSTAPTSTVFTVGSDPDVNYTNYTYVAYLFAHDDEQFGKDGDESIIKCGTYSGTGGAHVIDLGWEAQWVMLKRINGADNWTIEDVMRGMDTVESTRIFAQNNLVESSRSDFVFPHSTGFQFGATNGDGECNHSTGTYVYMAIRRGPMKTPEDATKVFNILADPGSGSARDITAGNLIDLQISKARDEDTGTNKWYWIDRVRGSTLFVNSASTDDEMSSQIGSTRFDLMDGMSVAAADGWTNASPWGGPYIRYFLTRAPGFFDVVAYTGNASTNDISHNLQAVPELMIFKNRDQTIGWPVWFGDGSNICRLDLDNGKFDEGLDLNATSATNIPISSGNSSYNNSGVEYIVYLFATLSGISKVGSETVGSSAIDVDCDFTGGARFVLIKRTDDVGDWYVYDSTRGIASGNDDFLLVNELDVESSNDYIDPFTTGFKINSSLPAGDYIYLAIA